MKNNENLTHQEIMSGLTMSFRELIATDVTDRKMPNIINRAKATAAVVTAAHREEIMELKRTSAGFALKSSESPTRKKLKKIN